MFQGYSADGTKKERTGWRDHTLSARHRDWGFNCPATDVDWIFIEYDNKRPIAIVEYKDFRATIDLKEANYAATADLANNYRPKNGVVGLPYLISRYWSDMWAFQVKPLNANAAEWFQSNEMLSERKYVTRLYAMRRRVVPPDIFNALGTEVPT